MPGLLPTAVPPSRMIFSICSSATEVCHDLSWKFRGLGLSAADAEPSPAPVAPWQGEQRIENSWSASATSGAGPVPARPAAGSDEDLLQADAIATSAAHAMRS